MMSQSIGQRIKELREARGVSQNQLAKKANISQSALSDIEKTTKSPNALTLMQLAEALDVTVAYLYGEKEVTAAEELSNVYFRFAKEAEKNEIDPDDIRKAIELIRKLQNSDN